MQVDVFNTEKTKVGKVELPEAIFGAEVNEALLWEQVKAQRASHRRGTHDTKTRGEVSGGGIKPFKQKGTGRARQGSSRAPNHVGGGTVFGPHPRDYSYRLPRSARRAALRSALSLRVKEETFIVLDAFSIEAPRTKSVVEFLERFGTSNVLFVDAGNENLIKSVRNLEKCNGVHANDINVYDILRHEHLIVTKAALEDVIRRAESVRQTTVSA